MSQAAGKTGLLASVGERKVKKMYAGMQTVKGAVTREKERREIELNGKTSKGRGERMKEKKLRECVKSLMTSSRVEGTVQRGK